MTAVTEEHVLVGGLGSPRSRAGATARTGSSTSGARRSSASAKPAPKSGAASSVCKEVAPAAVYRCAPKKSVRMGVITSGGAL